MMRRRVAQTIHEYSPERDRVSKRRVSRTIYECDGPNCLVETLDPSRVEATWISIHTPQEKAQRQFHRVECAIAYLSDLSHGFDAAVIRAHIGAPVPAGEVLP